MSCLNTGIINRYIRTYTEAKKSGKHWTHLANCNHQWLFDNMNNYEANLSRLREHRLTFVKIYNRRVNNWMNPEEEVEYLTNADNEFFCSYTDFSKEEKIPMTYIWRLWCIQASAHMWMAQMQMEEDDKRPFLESLFDEIHEAYKEFSVTEAIKVADDLKLVADWMDVFTGLYHLGDHNSLWKLVYDLDVRYLCGRGGRLWRKRLNKALVEHRLTLSLDNTIAQVESRLEKTKDQLLANFPSRWSTGVPEWLLLCRFYNANEALMDLYFRRQLYQRPTLDSYPGDEFPKFDETALQNFLGEDITSKAMAKEALPKALQRIWWQSLQGLKEYETLCHGIRWHMLKYTSKMDPVCFIICQCCKQNEFKSGMKLPWKNDGVVASAAEFLSKLARYIRSVEGPKKKSKRKKKPGTQARAPAEVRHSCSPTSSVSDEWTVPEMQWETGSLIHGNAEGGKDEETTTPPGSRSNMAQPPHLRSFEQMLQELMKIRHLPIEEDDSPRTGPTLAENVSRIMELASLIREKLASGGVDEQIKVLISVDDWLQYFLWLDRANRDIKDGELKAALHQLDLQIKRGNGVDATYHDLLDTDTGQVMRILLGLLEPADVEKFLHETEIREGARIKEVATTRDISAAATLEISKQGTQTSQGSTVCGSEGQTPGGSRRPNRATNQEASRRSRRKKGRKVKRQQFQKHIKGLTTGIHDVLDSDAASNQEEEQPQTPSTQGFEEQLTRREVSSLDILDGATHQSVDPLEPDPLRSSFDSLPEQVTEPESSHAGCIELAGGGNPLRNTPLEGGKGLVTSTIAPDGGIEVTSAASGHVKFQDARHNKETVEGVIATLSIERMRLASKHMALQVDEKIPGEYKEAPTIVSKELAEEHPAPKKYFAAFTERVGDLLHPHPSTNTPEAFTNKVQLHNTAPSTLHGASIPGMASSKLRNQNATSIPDTQQLRDSSHNRTAKASPPLSRRPSPAGTDDTHSTEIAKECSTEDATSKPTESRSGPRRLDPPKTGICSNEKSILGKSQEWVRANKRKQRSEYSQRVQARATTRGNSPEQEVLPPGSKELETPNPGSLPTNDSEILRGARHPNVPFDDSRGSNAADTSTLHEPTHDMSAAAPPQTSGKAIDPTPNPPSALPEGPNQHQPLPLPSPPPQVPPARTPTGWESCHWNRSLNAISVARGLHLQPAPEVCEMPRILPIGYERDHKLWPHMHTTSSELNSGPNMHNGDLPPDNDPFWTKVQSRPSHYEWFKYRARLQAAAKKKDTPGFGPRAIDRDTPHYNTSTQAQAPGDRTGPSETPETPIFAEIFDVVNRANKSSLAKGKQAQRVSSVSSAAGGASNGAPPKKGVYLKQGLGNNTPHGKETHDDHTITTEQCHPGVTSLRAGKALGRNFNPGVLVGNGPEESQGPAGPSRRERTAGPLSGSFEEKFEAQKRRKATQGVGFGIAKSSRFGRGFSTRAARSAYPREVQNPRHGAVVRWLEEIERLRANDGRGPTNGAGLQQAAEGNVISTAGTRSSQLTTTVMLSNQGRSHTGTHMQTLRTGSAGEPPPNAAEGPSRKVKEFRGWAPRK